MTDPRAWSVDLEQLARIEQRAREKLQAAGIAVPVKEQFRAGAAIPLPKPCDNAVWSLLAMVLYWARSLRVLLAAGRLRDASECMTRIRHNADLAMFGELLDDKERRDRLPSKAGKQSGRARRAKRTRDLESAAIAFNKLLDRSEWSQPTAARIATESGLTASRVRHLTISSIRKRAGTLRKRLLKK